MKNTLSLVFLFIFSSAIAQIASPVISLKRFAPEKVVNEINGIVLYERFNPQFGGDSIRNTSKGYACQGWVEDHYISGAVLHKGFYVDGQLTVYRNFYENGKVERIYKKMDNDRSRQQCFYSNGNLRSEIDFVKGKMQHTQLFYANGVTRSVEEYDPTVTYLVEKSSYYKNGDPELTMEMSDPAMLLYKQVEYDINGIIKLEGSLRFNNGIARYTSEKYLREGYWKVYNDRGELGQEMFYMNGVLSDPSKVNIVVGKKQKKTVN